MNVSHCTVKNDAFSVNFKHLSAHSTLFSINQSAYKEILFTLFSAEQKAAHNCKVSFHSSATTSVACLDTDQNDSFKCLTFIFGEILGLYSVAIFQKWV